MGNNLDKEIEKLKPKSPKELDLKERGIRDIPPNIEELDQLVRLNLSSNKLDSLPPQLGNLGNLKHLNLFNNKIAELPQEITKLSELEHLNASVNKLTSLPRGTSSISLMIATQVLIPSQRKLALCFFYCILLTPIYCYLFRMNEH